MMLVKEEFKVGEQAYRVVYPCGMLYTFGREYFLLSPTPVQPDWEDDTFERRFVVTPRNIVGRLDEDGSDVHSFARHIVTSAYTIDYAANMPSIVIERLEVGIDLADIEHPVRDVNDYIREKEEWLDEMIGLEGVG